MGSGSFLALMARIRSRHCRAAGREVNVHDDVLDFNANSGVDHVRDQSHVDDQYGGQADVAGKQAPADAGRFCSFHLDLAERLQQLQLQGSGSAHINWLLDALASTLSTHSSLRSALVSSCTAAAASPALPYSHLANQRRADEVLCLLDVCSALKQVADDVEHQLSNLQQALQSVGQALGHHRHETKPPLSSGRMRAAARRLSACLIDQHPHSLLHITSKQYRPLADARASLLLMVKTVELPTAAYTSEPVVTLLSRAMDGTTLTSLLLLASALSSLHSAPPLPRKSSGAAIALASKVITKYLGAKSVRAVPWAAPLRQLQRDLRQEEMASGGALFQELQSLHAAAANLHASITNPALHQVQPASVVRQSVDCLRKSSQEAQACMTMLRTHMASLFQALLALRLALLDS